MSNSMETMIQMRNKIKVYNIQIKRKLHSLVSEKINFGNNDS